jgi:hypothetical protein
VQHQFVGSELVDQDGLLPRFDLLDEVSKLSHGRRNNPVDGWGKIEVDSRQQEVDNRPVLLVQAAETQKLGQVEQDMRRVEFRLKGTDLEGLEESPFETDEVAFGHVVHDGRRDGKVPPVELLQKKFVVLLVDPVLEVFQGQLGDPFARDTKAVKEGKGEQLFFGAGYFSQRVDHGLFKGARTFGRGSDQGRKLRHSFGGLVAPSMESDKVATIAIKKRKVRTLQGLRRLEQI